MWLRLLRLNFIIFTLLLATLTFTQIIIEDYKRYNLENLSGK
jgi:hypothetical protein